MRVLDIPPFPQPIEIPDLENFLRTRISETIVMWPNQAIPLLGAIGKAITLVSANAKN